MSKERDETTKRLDHARSCWGSAFRAFENAREATQSAWYSVENKLALMDEEIVRLQAMAKSIQKAIEDCEWRKTQ